MEKRPRICQQFNYPVDQSAVILISKAGSEGLDMKGIRHLVYLEDNWTMAERDQIKGRAIRYLSHADLPPRDRNVTIHNLKMVVPSGVEYIFGGEKMHGLRDDKDYMIKHFIDSAPSFT
jgi:hypothetical protein